MAQNVLVTGGAGYIGAHTVLELDAAGLRPIILDNFSNSEKFVIERLQQLTGKHITVYEQDYTDLYQLKSVLSRERIDSIIHLAGYKQAGESVTEPLKYYQNNVSGLTILLQAARETNVQNIVLSSSLAVYGNSSALPSTEQSPTKTTASTYATSLQMAETVLRDVTRATPSLKSLSLRIGNVVGAHNSAQIGEVPHSSPTNLAPSMTSVAAGLREQVTVFGDNYETSDGTCIRDYVHVTDVARSQLRSLAYLDGVTGAQYDAINIGSGKGLSVFEMLLAFERATGVKVPYAIADRRPGDTPATYAKIDKAAQLLNWKPELSLEQALADAWKWQQSVGRGV